MDPADLSRWHTFLKWAHARKYAVNLYRPRNLDNKMYYDYRVQLRMKGMDGALVSRESTLESALDDIKKQLLEMSPG